MDNYKKVEMSRKQIIVNNFIGGISWGLGATIGLAIILAILTLVLKTVNLVPLVGDFAAKVSVYTTQKTSK
ncbi:MAG TPA: DUF5665 domain-containing protein [Patescibacteria group bacterium]|nr:DUF5665 domain-containing protein [Patescibacteria group bacterium]